MKTITDDRLLIRFRVECIKTIQHHITDERLLKAITTAERYAASECNNEDLRAALEELNKIESEEYDKDNLSYLWYTMYAAEFEPILYNHEAINCEILSAVQHLVNPKSIFDESVRRVARAVTYLNADHKSISKALKEYQAVSRKKHTTRVDQKAVIQKYPTVVEFRRQADEARERGSQLIDQIRSEFLPELAWYQWNGSWSKDSLI
jgi:hypothetical protein